MKKKWISALLAVALLLTMLPALTLEADASYWIEYDERYEVDGSYYTTSTKMAQKLNAIFDGNANIYHDRGCTNSVNVRIGTSNVKNNGITMYAGPYGGSYKSAGTSCWIYAAGVYYTLFGEVGFQSPGRNSEALNISATSSRITSYANFKAWGVRDGVGAHIRTSSHSMIVLDYDEEGLTILDGNNDGNGKVSVRKRSWDRVNYTVSYITQPKDSFYYSEYPVYDCEHDYTSQITKQAGCVEDGVVTYTCTKCPDSFTESIPATGHNFQNDYCVVCNAYDSSILKGTCGSDLNWTLRTGTLTVTGSGDMYDYGYSGAPWFKNRTSIKSVVVDGGITHIGDHAFAFSENLTSVTIGDSVTAIGDFAFQSCPKISSLTLGSSVKTIGLEAFKYTAIKNLNIPDSTTYIGDLAFGFCEALGEVRLGKGVATIRDAAFYNTPSLKKITFRGSAPAIGEEAFMNARAAVHYPTNDPTWTSKVMQDYGGVLTWKSYYQGLNPVGDTWGYYDEGVLQADYTGLVPYEGNWFYVENGVVTWNYIGLVYHDGQWRYVVNSRFDDEYLGLVYHNDAWLYVVNGCVDWSYNGLGYSNEQWYFIENGQWKEDHTGLVYFNNTWFYVENGHLTWDYTGLVEYNGNRFYVQNNVLDWGYTGLGYHDGEWYFIQNALLQLDFTGLVNFNNTWFYVENGHLTWDYTGLVEYEGNWFYVQNNELDWGYTGLGYHDGGWYFIQNARVQADYNGLVNFNETWFYIENGELTWTANGLYAWNNTLYYIKNSEVDWSYTGKAIYNGIEYDVVNGVAVL